MSKLKSSSSSLAAYLLGAENEAANSPRTTNHYGAISANGVSPSLVPSSRPLSPIAASPRRERERVVVHDLDDLTEDEEEVEELVDVPYQTLIRNYALVPIFSVAAFVTLIALFIFCWPPPENDSRTSYPYHVHWADLLVGCAAWILSYSLRIPTFLLSTCFGRFTNAFTMVASTTLHTLIEEALRWSGIILLGIQLAYLKGHPEWVPFPDTRDEAYRRTFWFALGWAMIEVAFSIAQGYEQLHLYKEILSEDRGQGYRASYVDLYESDDNLREVESVGHQYVHSAMYKANSPSEDEANASPQRPLQFMDVARTGPFIMTRQPQRLNLDAEMQQLINIQTRAELESVYGVPPPNIPVFVSILQRFDSILLTLGLTLTLSSEYVSQLVKNPLPSNHPDRSSPPHPDVSAAVRCTLPTFLLLVSIHAILAVMWTEALPRIGVHTASYTALLIALGIFFVGLASWGALT